MINSSLIHINEEFTACIACPSYLDGHNKDEVFGYWPSSGSGHTIHHTSYLELSFFYQYLHLVVFD